MDLSPQAYAAIHEDDPQGTPDRPRPMSWQLATCPRLGNVRLQYQTQANPWWTSLWVRAATRPVTKVEVKSANHADFFALRRETNGTWNDDGGFGMGSFELRISAEGAAAPLSAKFDGFTAGALVDTGMQF
jgi:expansin (peptidoglycan-binding protein)